MARWELRLSGNGGQGLITAGIILARAGAIYDGKYAVQTQSYGPEARGGASKSEVIISDEPILYPKPMMLDVLLALSQEACDKYLSELKQPAGLLLIDSLFVRRPPKGNFKMIALGFTELARDRVGKVLVANLLALGALVQLTECVRFASLAQAVTEYFPPSTGLLNQQALEEGKKAAEAL